nr:helix-turn-helix domain-containing protein [Armatimonadota bacterium]
MQQHYGRYGAQGHLVGPLSAVPSDFDKRLKNLRRDLRLTQAALANRIGAAGKAVIYQWESRKRTPSPIFWERAVRLQRKESPASQRPVAVEGLRRSHL